MAEENKVSTLKRSQFACQACKGEDDQGAFFFFAVAADIRENEKGDTIATCPQCGAEAEELWYCATIRRLKSEGRWNGPATEAGKNKVRMNGLTTGSRYSGGKIPKYLPPAKPDKYPECDDCQDLEECKEAVADAMGTCRFVACHRKTEIFTKYREAHMTGPEALRITAAENHARMQMVLNALFKKIFEHGVLVDSIVVNKDGVVMYGGAPLTELKSNPAINEMIKLAEKMGFGLTDWTLTPKSKEAKAALEGYLAGQAAAKNQAADEFIDQYRGDIKKFHDALERGNAAMQKDETLKEALADEQEKKPGE